MNPAVAIVALASLVLAICIWRFGTVRPGYSQMRHTISELAESGALRSEWVSYGVFLPFGLAMLLVAWLSQAGHPAAAHLAACLAAGYLGAALFPCDPGSPLSGSWRQALHNIAGAIQYVGGGLVLFQLASSEPWFEVSSFVVLAAGVLLSVPAVSAFRGGIQRVAEVVLLANLVALLNRPGGA